jgi:hypothetical protein
LTISEDCTIVPLERRVYHLLGDLIEYLLLRGLHAKDAVKLEIVAFLGVVHVALATILRDFEFDFAVILLEFYG